MPKMISKSNPDFSVEGTLIEAVSLFDRGIDAYNIENVSNELVQKLQDMDIDDIEEFCEDNNIDKIELDELTSGQYGTDMYIPSMQPTTKAFIVADGGRETFIYDGGVREYLEDFDFDETQKGIEYLVGNDVRIIFETDDLEIIDD